MILSIILGFIFGIFIGSIFPVTFGLALAVLLLSCICFVYRYFITDPHRTTAALCSVFIFSALFGMGRIFISDIYNPSHLTQFEEQKITAEGVIVSEPDVRERKTQLTIGLRSIGVASSTIAVRENILVSVPLYPEFSYGDLVSVNTTLSVPKDIESEDGRIFDYKNYLRVRGIWYVGRSPHVKFISAGHGSELKSILFKIKHTFTDSLNRAIPQPESSLLAGLLIGSKQALGKDLLGEFSRAGVSHIVVLSGYNIAIVAESIMALLVFLPITISFLVGCISIVLFTILSGGGASGVRAAIMVLVALFAKRTNREYAVSRAFGFAVILMLAVSPSLLVFDPSFQLSILATIGIIFISPFISPYFGKVTEKYGLHEIISSTVATQIIVLPFLIYNTGVLSLVSLPVNVLILGTIPLTMLLGFITGIFGLLSLYLSFIPALFTYALLWYQLTIVHLGASLPFGAIELPAFSFGILIFVYVCIGVGLYFLKKKLD